MELSDADIDEFMLIYKEEIGKDISRSDAYELAYRFLAGFKAAYKPIPTIAQEVNDTLVGE